RRRRADRPAGPHRVPGGPGPGPAHRGHPRFRRRRDGRGRPQARRGAVRLPPPGPRAAGPAPGRFRRGRARRRPEGSGGGRRVKRLAYFCTDPGVPVFGAKGASVHVQEVVRAFRAAGWEAVLYCVRRGGPAPADLAGLAVVERRVPGGPAAEREAAVAEAAAALAGEAVRDGFDLAYERYALFGRAGAIAARK